MAKTPVEYESTWENVAIPSITGVTNHLTFKKNDALKRARVSGYISLTALQITGSIGGLFSNASPTADIAVSVFCSIASSASVPVLNAYVQGSTGNFSYRSTSAANVATNIWISCEWDIS